MDMEFKEGSSAAEITIQAAIYGGVAVLSFVAGYLGGKQSTAMLTYLGLKLNPSVDINEYYTGKQIKRFEQKIARGIKKKLKKEEAKEAKESVPKGKFADRATSVKVTDNNGKE